MALLLTSIAPLAAAGESVDLNVMTFNIEWGGTHVSWDNVVEAIRSADADIVAVQEAEGNLVRLAGEFGWYFDRRNYVISRFPVLDPPGADGRYVFVEVAPGRIVALANVHLPSDPYGPDRVRDGAAPDEVLALERRVRLVAIEPYLVALPPLFKGGIPVFMAGDFNSPAYTDWTATTVGQRPFLRYPLAWPVSEAVVAAGFRDSWREVYPDPVTHPGLTWWAARPPLALYSPGENDARDRIDFIWFAGPVAVQRSALAGKAGEDEVSIGLDPWPSDHRAVVSGFSATAAPMPELVTTRRRIYAVSDQIEVVFNTAVEARIAIDKAETRTVSGRGSFRIPASLPGPGRHTVSMTTAGSATRLERIFWVQADDVAPEVTVQGDDFAVGEGIGVRWANAPGNRNDYLVVDRPDAQPGYETGLAWAYIDALPEGRLLIDEQNAAWGWPVPPGHYVIRLLKDDGAEQLAVSQEFTIHSGGPK